MKKLIIASTAILCLSMQVDARTKGSNTNPQIHESNESISVPMPGDLDSRIVNFAYTPDVVFQLPVTVGMHTHIPMGEGESLIEIPRIGEKVRWRVEGNEKNLYVKALAPNIKTSLSLVTNKRVYQFELIATRNPQERIQQAKFTYPDEEAGIAVALSKAHNEAVESAKNKEQHLKNQNLSDMPIPSGALFFYHIHSSSEEFQRMHIYADGVKTWMRLPPGIQDLPAVFMVGLDENGKEALMPVNYTVLDKGNVRERDVIVIDRTAAEWRLRIGANLEVRATKD